MWNSAHCVGQAASGRGLGEVGEEIADIASAPLSCIRASRWPRATQWAKSAGLWSEGMTWWTGGFGRDVNRVELEVLGEDDVAPLGEPSS